VTTEEFAKGVKVGQMAPEFEMDTYDPTEHYFGKVSLRKLKEQGRWTILFFYPADFTFV
jgi:alkyl hydroperoxide reductase subunit AhpC